MTLQNIPNSQRKQRRSTKSDLDKSDPYQTRECRPSGCTEKFPMIDHKNSMEEFYSRTSKQNLAFYKFSNICMMLTHFYVKIYPNS